MRLCNLKRLASLLLSPLAPLTNDVLHLRLESEKERENIPSSKPLQRIKPPAHDHLSLVCLSPSLEIVTRSNAPLLVLGLLFLGAFPAMCIFARD